MSTQIKTPVQAISKSFDLHIDTQKQMTAVLDLINTQDEHIKLITTKLLKIEKTLARYQMSEQWTVEGADEHRNNS
jgi:hypothetical protein